MAFGREGNYVLVNGHVNPRLAARSGAPQRWRIVNAAKSRFFGIDLDGELFTMIGGDGGLQEYPVESDMLLADARRARGRHRRAAAAPGRDTRRPCDSVQPRLRQRRVSERRGLS